jgi:hypothetical protein
MGPRWRSSKATGVGLVGHRPRRWASNTSQYRVTRAGSTSCSFLRFKQALAAPVAVAVAVGRVAHGTMPGATPSHLCQYRARRCQCRGPQPVVVAMVYRLRSSCCCTVASSSASVSNARSIRCCMRSTTGTCSTRSRSSTLPRCPAQGSQTPVPASMDSGRAIQLDGPASRVTSAVAYSSGRRNSRSESAASLMRFTRCCTRPRVRVRVLKRWRLCRRHSLPDARPSWWRLNAAMAATPVTLVVATETALSAVVLSVVVLQVPRQCWVRRQQVALRHTTVRSPASPLQASWRGRRALRASGFVSPYQRDAGCMRRQSCCKWIELDVREG